MLRPRSFTREERSAYLQDVRPRFLLLRVRADKVNIVWGVPLWALEEVAAFALGATAFLSILRPVLPAQWSARLYGLMPSALNRFSATDPAAAKPPPKAHKSRLVPDLFRLTDELAGGSLRDVLRLPPGESYVLVNAGDTRVELTAY